MPIFECASKYGATADQVLGLSTAMASYKFNSERFAPQVCLFLESMVERTNIIASFLNVCEKTSNMLRSEAGTKDVLKTWPFGVSLDFAHVMVLLGKNVDWVNERISWAKETLNEVAGTDYDLGSLAHEDIETHEPLFGMCEVEGCSNEGTSGGFYWRETGYWTICSEHSALCRQGGEQPKMKRAAIEREKTRGADGILPLMSR